MIYYVLILLVPVGVYAQVPVSFSDNTPLSVDAVVPVNSQYHTQDTSGQYSYGYSNGESSKEESRSSDGVTRGSYSYVDSNGVLQSVSYEADAEHGFRVAATNLPTTPSLQSISSPNNEVIFLKKIRPTTGNINELPAKENSAVAAKQANDTKGKYTSQKDTENKVEQTIPESNKNEDSLNSLKIFPAKQLSPNTNTEKSTTANNKVLVNNGDFPLRFVHPLVKINSRYTPIPVTYSSGFNNELNSELFLVNQLSNYYNGLWNRANYEPLVGRENVYQSPSQYMIYDGLTPLLRQNSFVPAELSNVQYHLQNDRGHYLYGYNNQLGAKEERMGADGVTRGFYSYPDAHGQLQSISYTADDVHGFNSVSSSLPHWPFIVPLNK